MEKKLYEALGLLVDRHDDQQLTKQEWDNARAVLNAYDLQQVREQLKVVKDELCRAWECGSTHNRPDIKTLNRWREVINS